MATTQRRSAIVPPENRKRLFYGRVRGACTRCRLIRKKCDGNSPCGTCARTGRPCSIEKSRQDDSESSPELPVSPPPFTFKGGQDLLLFSDWVGGSSGAGPFWNDGVFPAAQSNETVFHALISDVYLHKTPLNEAISGLSLPKKAIESYCKSLATREPDLKLILMTASLYCSIESRIGHVENIQTITKSMFAIIVSHRAQFESRYLLDGTMFGIVEDMVAGAPYSHADPRCIPREHWQVIISLYVQMATARQVLTPVFLLKLEWARIAFEVSRGEEDTVGLEKPSIGHQLNSLKRNLYKFQLACQKEGKQISIKFLERDIRSSELAWHFLQWRRNGDKLDQDIFRINAESLLKDLEAFPDISKREGFVEYWIDAHILQTVVRIAYYLRAADVSARLKQILSKYEGRIVYLDKVYDFIDEIEETEYDTPSSIELEMFGPDPPSVLRHCQLSHIVDHLARSSERSLAKAGNRGKNLFFSSNL